MVWLPHTTRVGLPVADLGGTMVSCKKPVVPYKQKHQKQKPCLAETFAVASSYRRIASLRTAEQFTDYLDAHQIQLPFDAELSSGPESPLAAPLEVAGRKIGNRFTILPMEGWDGTTAGSSTKHMVRRWRNFGLSGAKLIWGGEAVAVEHAARANPNQLWLHEQTKAEIGHLRTELLETHRESFGKDDDLLVGLQLTHSGRFSRPNSKDQLEPIGLYHHPILDERCGGSDKVRILSDLEIDDLIEKFVNTAAIAADLGFDFVDIKHCHGYLGHEFLSGFDRPGRYGGSFENRTRFLREIVSGIRDQSPDLMIAVRLSAIDWIPFQMGSDGVGEPCPLEDQEYRFAFGGDKTGIGIDLSEPVSLLKLLEKLNIHLVCTSAGSPYYNPHIQRPAYFPPTDGYQPPEDPLAGVARQIELTRQLKQACPNLTYVGSGYSYLQQWLPNVGQAVVRNGGVDSVGLGRMVLSYPDLPVDVLAGRKLQHKRICRTFSDCTSGPRNGMISGCYPLDEHYRQLDERKELDAIKATFRKSMGSTTQK